MRYIFLFITLTFFFACSSGSKSQTEEMPADTDTIAAEPDIADTADTFSEEPDESEDTLTPDIDSIVFGPFQGTIILGAPTGSSIKAKILSHDKSGTIFLTYGKNPNSYDRQTTPSAITAGKPLEIAADGLSPDTQYYYRLELESSDGTGFSLTDEYTFHTARPEGSSFTFTIQADSHLDENSVLDLYRLTLANVLADAPDFHIDLGDTFMCEKHSLPLDATVQSAPDQATVNARYEYDMNNFGIVAHSVPLFLVNGNHEGEAGWFLDGTASNLPIWTTLARKEYFPTPAFDVFYTGDGTEEQFVGKRAAWYSWKWGNALFIVLDPYWNTKTKGNNDSWVFTLGETQYNWLKETLSKSTETFKFVFIHSLIGGLDGQLRGGIEAAPYYEWGGKNEDGTDVFSEKRPGWSMPVHQMLVQYGVSAVFHGHDHFYAKQDLDGVVYQEVPQPSAKNSTGGPGFATKFHYNTGTILSSSGHLRVTVTPERATAEYIRTWLPENENDQQKNGSVDDTWTVEAK